MDAFVEIPTPLFIFVTPLDPEVLDRISVVADTTSVPLQVTIEEATVSGQWQVTIEPESFELYVTLHGVDVDIFTPKRRDLPRRVNRTAWQARLAAKLDPIKRKVIDNQIMLSGFPIDMLRISTKRDKRTGDVQTRTVVSNEVLPIIFPEMKDVPLRRLTRDGDSGAITLDLDLSVNNTHTGKIDVFCPYAAQLERDDLLIRIWDDTVSDLPYVTVFQVKDQLGTFTTNSLLYIKHQLTLFDEQLPNQVIQVIVDTVRKRSNLRW